MPQDSLQIALEHHHAGRLKEAEAGYRAILAASPHDPEALGWLGVLTFQAGRAADAVPLLEQALAERPADAAFWNNLGQAYLVSGKVSHAIWALEVSIGLHPDRTDAIHAIGRALLQRNEPGDAEEAIRRFEEAHSAGVDSAELHQHLGIALLRANRIEDAIAACHLAVEKNPEYAEAHYHLGVAHRMKGDAAQARTHLLKALDLKPDYARAAEGLAVLEVDRRNFAAAEALFRQAIASKPDSVAAHKGLAVVLQKLGRGAAAEAALAEAGRLAQSPPASPAAETGEVSEAVASLERKLTPSPAAAALHFRLATTAGILPPPRMPRPRVTALFEEYASRFDEHLQDQLQYRVPEQLAEAVNSLHPGKPLDVLDLGCGTGLCGPLLRPLAASMTGVDLSPAMLDKARTRGVYDRLERGDYLGVLRQYERSLDLVVAADVFVYAGDLAPTFAAAAAALRSGGMFAFSTELGSAPRYELNKTTHRFTHSRAYLHRLGSIYGFEEALVNEITVRKDAGKDVPGLLVILRLAPDRTPDPTP